MFVAIALPAAVRVELGRVQRELRAGLPPSAASWSKPDNLHLTLRFLGDVEASRAEEAVQRLQSAMAGFGELDLVCERLGCFPDMRLPRVVWAGVHEDGGRLAALASRVNGAMDSFAEKPAESAFTGHITLARPKRLRRTEAERLAHFIERTADRRFGAWRVGEVELIRSELLPTGSRYTTLATASLLKSKT